MKITAKERELQVEKEEDDGVLLKLILQHLSEDIKDLQVRISRLEKNMIPNHNDIRDIRAKVAVVGELYEYIRGKEVAKLENDVKEMQKEYGMH